MSLTPNFGMNIPDAADTVNLLTQCYPNFTLLDGVLQSIKESGVTTASETKSGTTHQLVRTVPACSVLRFTATSNFVTGDSFTVDGTPVTAVAVNGTSLQTGDFVINSNVIGIVVGAVLTLFAGGNSAPDASDVTYDNTGSGLTANDVQSAIDELKNDIPTSLAASAITYDNTGSGLTATNAQDAIDEVNSKIATPEKVEVSGNGVKTRSQLFDELYALIDVTKLTPKSVLVRQTATYLVRSFDMSDLKFSNTYATNNAFSIDTIELKSSASKEYVYSGSYSEVSGSVIPSGDKITLYY